MLEQHLLDHHVTLSPDTGQRCDFSLAVGICKYKQVHRSPLDDPFLPYPSGQGAFCQARLALCSYYPGYFATSSMDEIAIQKVVNETAIAFGHFIDSRYLAIAAYVAMVYDHVLTLDDEVTLIWMKPFNLVSILFLINRYTVPIVIAVNVYDKGGSAGTLSDKFCANWFLTEGYFQTICHSFTHALVAFRVSALWGKNRILNAVLCLLFIAYLTATLTVGTMIGVQSFPSFHFNKMLGMCIGEISDWAFWTWVPALLFESVLFALTIVKAVHYRRLSLHTNVAHTLYRDGIVYFLVIAICTIFNVITWSVLPPSFVGLAKYSTFSIVNMTGSKMILNLRALSKVDDEDLIQSHPASNHEMGNFNAGSRARWVQVNPPNPQVISIPLRPKTSFEHVPSQRSRDVKWSQETGWRNERAATLDVTSGMETHVEVSVDIERHV